MAKFFKKIILLSFLFCTLNNLNSLDLEPIKLEKLDQERIKTKIDFYKKIEDKAKLFRTLTYITGALTATSILGLTGYKIYKYVTADKNKPEKYKNNISNNINNAPEYRDKYYYRLLYKDRGLWQLIKDGFLFGVTDGIYWTITSVLVTAGMAITARCYNITEEKFFSSWYGKNCESLKKFKEQVRFDLAQFKSFLISDFYDKKEMAIYYKNFIYTIEHFIALISVLVETKPEQFRQKEVILAGKDLLINRVNTFTKNLEQKLNTIEQDKIEAETLEEINISFDQLGIQIIRFANLCC
ncbi:MAG: hypothetical protein WC436_05385 [Candidatus Babeliales bacterium]